MSLSVKSNITAAPVPTPAKDTPKPERSVSLSSDADSDASLKIPPCVIRDTEFVPRYKAVEEEKMDAKSDTSKKSVTFAPLPPKEMIKTQAPKPRENILSTAASKLAEMEKKFAKKAPSEKITLKQLHEKFGPPTAPLDKCDVSSTKTMKEPDLRDHKEIVALKS